jgi:hypothetical protein
MSHKTKNKIQTKTNKKRTQCALDCPQANTINVNKTWTLLQTTRGKDEPNIVCIRKSQHRTRNVKTHNRRTQQTKKMRNKDLNDM